MERWVVYDPTIWSFYGFTSKFDVLYESTDSTAYDTESYATHEYEE